MAGDLSRLSFDAAANAAVMSALAIAHIRDAYTSDTDRQTPIDLDELRQRLEEGDRQALVEALPSLMAQLRSQQQQEQPA